MPINYRSYMRRLAQALSAQGRKISISTLQISSGGRMLHKMIISEHDGERWQQIAACWSYPDAVRILAAMLQGEPIPDISTRPASTKADAPPTLKDRRAK